eukprot:scaffold28152_cov86-Isochrysis_galbana.AAC.2
MIHNDADFMRYSSDFYLGHLGPQARQVKGRRSKGELLFREPQPRPAGLVGEGEAIEEGGG